MHAGSSKWGTKLQKSVHFLTKWGLIAYNDNEERGGVRVMKETFDSEWTLKPAGGESGQAYMGQSTTGRVFLKRNSSPFLAALSKEGLTPKLVWSKRTNDGAVYSAQEWLNGRSLRPSEMNTANVQALIRHYQQSANLLNMLKKIGGEEYTAEDLLEELITQLQENLKRHRLYQACLNYLRSSVTYINAAALTVSHSDLSADNFFLAENNRLYLVDWDNCRIADAFLDTSAVLLNYVPFDQWQHWFDQYPLPINKMAYLRLEWYSIYNLLNQINFDLERGDMIQVNAAILKLKHIYMNRYFYHRH